MTYEEVRNNFIQYLAENTYSNMCSTEEMKIVIEALEKQIPKKVIKPCKGTYKCPTCENYIYVTDDDMYVYGIEPPKYCDECGQVIDWGKYWKESR